MHIYIYIRRRVLRWLQIVDPLILMVKAIKACLLTTNANMNNNNDSSSSSSSNSSNSSSSSK